MKNQEFRIGGMHCASCVNLIEKNLLKLSGIQTCLVNLSLNKASIEYDENVLSESEIIKNIESYGYSAKILNKNDDIYELNNLSQKKYFKNFVLSFLLTIPIFLTMFLKLETGIKIIDIDLMMRLHLGLSLVVVYCFGFGFHKNFLTNLLKLQFNMDSLISIGTTAAFFLSVWNMFKMHGVYFEAASAIIVFINFGKWLESKSQSGTMQAMNSLMELSVKNATILVDGKEYQVEIDSVLVGDILIVKPGEKIPLDGEIIFGESNIDESVLNGESIPNFKKIQDKVFGSTLNLDGTIQIKVTGIGEDTVFAQILKLVSQSKKAEIEKLADKISGYFVPFVILISLISFIGWYLYSGNVESSIIKAVCILVIACPCSLGLATPTAIIVGTGLAAKHGILIKSPEIFEKSKKIDIVAFDKTGTLSVGKPTVTDVKIFDCDEKYFAKIVFNLSSFSNHPLSKSIANYYQNIEKIEILNFKEIPGKGIYGIYENNELLIGNIKFMDEYGIQIDKAEYETFANRGLSVNLVAIGGKFAGLIGVFDEPKPHSANTIKSLNSLGIKTIILSGDGLASVQNLANRVGISEFYSQMLPGEKSQKIKELQSGGNIVAFVGDGINDAPSLAQADIGIAMADASDIAIQTGDIILLGGKIQQVPIAIDISKTTFKIIKQNLFWAFCYNVVGIPVAAMGFLSPEIASFAMAMSSVSVILNSLRIRFRKEKSNL